MWTAYVPVISRIVRLKSTTSSVPFPVWAAEPENRGDRFDTMLHKHWVYAKHQANAVKHDCFKNIKLERIVHSIYMSVLCDIIIYISLYRMSSQNHVGREKSWLLRPVKQPVCLFSHENQAMMIFLLRWTLHSAPLNQRDQPVQPLKFLSISAVTILRSVCFSLYLKQTGVRFSSCCRRTQCDFLTRHLNEAFPGHEHKSGMTDWTESS